MISFVCLLFLFFSPSNLSAGDPSVLELHAEVIHYLKFDQEEMEGWKKKARWAAALPRLQAGFQRDLKDVAQLSTQNSVSITGGDVFIGPDKNQFDQDFNQGTSFDVKAIWYLDEVVFNRDSLMVSGEIRDWVRERNRALQEATEAYFARKRLLQELREKEIPPDIREQKKLLLDRASATLDALTGGWFSTRLGKP